MNEGTVVVTLGQLLTGIAIVVAITSLLVVLQGMLINSKTKGMSETLVAKAEGMGKTLEARAKGIGDTLDAKVACIQEAVAAGTEEHKMWREEIGKTNKRLDDLLMHLLNRDGGDRNQPAPRSRR